MPALQGGVDAEGEEVSNDTPCRVSADLRAYEAEQDRLEREWQLGKAGREVQAAEDCMDAAKLKAMLQDEDLAHPLASLMQDLELGADLEYSVGKLKARLVEMLLEHI